MKGLFLLLLLCNIAFFGYHYMEVGKKPSSSQSQAILSPNDSAIKLVAEEKNNRPQPSSAQPIKATAENSNRVVGEKMHSERKLNESCFELAGFAAEDDAKATLNKLLNGGFTGSISQYSQRTLVGYWVMTPRYRTRSEISKVIRAMQEKSVDNFIFESGEDKGAISVGLFKNKRNATDRKEEVRKLGFNVKVKEHYRDVNLYSLSLVYRGSTAAPSLKGFITNSGNKIAAVEKKCPQQLDSR